MSAMTHVKQSSAMFEGPLDLFITNRLSYSFHLFPVRPDCLLAKA